MQGIVYFGHQSLNTEKWNQIQEIEDELENLKALIENVNSSYFARVTVPHNWFEERCSSLDFWEKLTEICSGNHELFGYITQQLFDGAFNNCIDKSCNLENALNNVAENNPSLENAEFYGVIKGLNDWTGIPVNYSVSSKQDLIALARMMLSKHSIGEPNFAFLCKYVFPNLEFHSDFAETLRTHGATSKESSYTSPAIRGVNGFSVAITSALKAMDEIDLREKGTKAILAEIAANSGFECSPQGPKKDQLKFEFYRDNKAFKVNCEFHIKINRNNSNDGVHYHDRIYFGFATSNGNRKILVAHSGCHL